MIKNEGTARLLQNINKQSKSVFDINITNNTLGTVTSNGIRLDGIDDEIPMSEFLFLHHEYVLKNNDRVACVPIGSNLLVLGKVNENG